MKFLYPLIILFSFFQNAVLAQNRIAFLVAAHDYERYNTNWKNLNSKNDIPLVRDVLLQRGFDRSNIIELEDNVTKEAIVSTFKKQVIEKARPGDVVLFHFSGHGYQIPDDSGDETDGLDEALVPEDAIYDRDSILSPNYYSNYIRDDELRELLDALRIKIGEKGNVVVLIDACHSGTATRGHGTPRGANRTNRPNMIAFASDNSEKTYNEADFGIAMAGSGKAPMACIFGSGEHQLNWEYIADGIKCGSLSYAFASALSETGSNASYRALFEKIRIKMAVIAPLQQPHAEGEFDQVIFGGRLLGIANFLKVKDFNDDGTIIIDAGNLQGLFPETELGFYPPDTRNIKEVTPLVKGKVISAALGEATVKLLNPDFNYKTLKNSWVYILNRNFGNTEVTLNILSPDLNNRTTLIDYLKAYPFVRVTDTDASNLKLYFGTLNANNQPEVSLITHDGYVIYDKTVSEMGLNIHFDNIIQEICNYSQAKFLRAIEHRNQEKNLAVEIIPFQKKAGTTGRRLSDYEEVSAETIKAKNVNSYVIQEGTFIKLRIINKSYSPSFISIIDIRPDNMVSVLFPAGNKMPQEYRINGGDTILYENHIFEIKPPYGEEILKIIASATPLDLSLINQSRGAAATRSTYSSIEKIFSGSFKGVAQNRSLTTPNLEDDDIGIYSQAFRIIPVKSIVENGQ